MSLRDITEAANDLSVLLESSAPKGLRKKEHAKHIKPARAKIKAVMAHFFDRQRKAVLAIVEPRIKRALLLHPRAIMESVAGIPPVGLDVTHSGYTDRREFRESSAQSKTFARDLIPHNLHPLTFAATAAETDDYNEAITDLIRAAANSLSASAATSEDLAGDYLARNSLSKLTGGLNSTSIERLQDSLANAWDAGGSYDSMVSAIRETFDDFSETRAGLIAVTESSDAYNAGRRETALSLGFDEHAWETESGDPCPECEANEAQGWLDIDEDFQSGDDAPTAHPACLCVVNFRKSSGSEDEE